jgi:HrpA-like RNA helicase
MSATASAEFFIRYFASVTQRSTPPISLEIPGRSYPVQIQWLCDCERFAGTKLQVMNHNASSLKASDTTQQESNENRVDLSPRAMQKIDNHFIRTLIGKIVQQQQAEGQLSVPKSSNQSVSQHRDTGAILVFLPGKAEIEALARCLYDDKTSLVGDRSRCKILKLYSSIPRSEQQIVFQPAAVGTVKIVLSTNIAETSVTIPDVSHVIDTGRVKEARFNPSARIKELVTVWTSQASSKQRAGRAGRTSAGVCWRLFSEDFCNQSMLLQTAPEMVRTPLDELILQICLLYEQHRDEHQAKVETGNNSRKSNDGTGPAKTFPPGVRPIQFLSKTPSPPPESALLEGCRHLLDVDALRIVNEEGDETSRLYRLTPLGYHLSRLPMDAKVGKVLIVGCIMGCLDGALTVAASLSCTKSCFLSLWGSGMSQNQHAAVQARESLVANGFGGRNWAGGTVKGDLIAVVAVYRAWKKGKSDKKQWDFCKFHALDHLALKEMDQLRNQYLDLLADAGLVSSKVSKDVRALEMNECNKWSEDALLTSCCLVAGLYPNVCTLMRPRKGGCKGGRLLTKEGDVCRPHFTSFQKKRVQEAAEVGKDAYGVFHAKQTTVGTPSSVAVTGGIQRPSEVFLTEVNFISRFALLLFGGNLEIVKNAIIVDDWLKFKVISGSDNNTGNDGLENAVLILALRETLDKVILEHILETASSKESKEAMRERHQAVIQVVRRLLSDEG